MKKRTAVFLLLAAVAFSLSAVTVDPANAVIVVKKNADGTVHFAARELQFSILAASYSCELFRSRRFGPPPTPSTFLPTFVGNSA